MNPFLVLAGLGYLLGAGTLAYGSYRGRPLAVALGTLPYIIATNAAVALQSTFIAQVGVVVVSLMAITVVCVGTIKHASHRQNWPRPQDIVVRSVDNTIVTRSEKGD